MMTKENHSTPSQVCEPDENMEIGMKVEEDDVPAVIQES